MSSLSTIPVARPTLWHLFGVAPRVRQEGDGSLALTRTLANRVALVVCVLIFLLIAVVHIRIGLRTGEWEWGRVILYPVFLLVAWMPWSVVSVTFDRTLSRMRVRRSFYPLRRARDRSLGDLRAVLVVKFKNMPFGHVRLIFGESNPRTVEVAAFWRPARAVRVANQLAAYLGVPLEETTYPPKRGAGKSRAAE